MAHEPPGGPTSASATPVTVPPPIVTAPPYPAASSVPAAPIYEAPTPERLLALRSEVAAQADTIRELQGENQLQRNRIERLNEQIRRQRDLRIKPWQRNLFIAFAVVLTILLIPLVIPRVVNYYAVHFSPNHVAVFGNSAGVVVQSNGTGTGPTTLNGSPGSIILDNGQVVFVGNPIRLHDGSDGLPHDDPPNGNDINLGDHCSGRVSTRTGVPAVHSLVCDGQGMQLDPICNTLGLHARNPFETPTTINTSPAGSQLYWYCG